MERSPSDDVDQFIQKFQSWPENKQVNAIKKMLTKMNHSQHSQINHALEPLLQRDFITMLPQRGLIHLAQKILSYLDAESLSMASSVCREWDRIIREGFLWKQLIAQKIKTDSAWAGIVRKKRISLDRCTMNQNRGKACYGDRKLYFEILGLINNLDKTWRDGKYTTQQIVCQCESSKGVYCIQYDDNKIVSGLRDNTIKIWDRNTLECTKTFQGHTGSVLCLQYNDDVIVSGSSDATVRVWDVNAPDNSQPLLTAIQHSEAVLHLKFIDKTMVTCSKDRSIVVWEMNSPKDLRVVSAIVGHRAAVNVVDFDTNFIVSASGDRSIKVWDTKNFQLIRTLNGHRRGIACLQYRKNLIVSGSSDNTIRIWDIHTGNCLRVMEGHDELVRCIKFDDKWIVSGAYDGKIKIWDLKKALDETAPDSILCVRTLQKHTGRVFRLQFDEFQIVSSSHDDSIIIWDFLS